MFSKSKRSLLIVSFKYLGGTLMGPPFSGYALAGPAVLPAPPRGHHAFYPQPIFYWAYPSPPVSPTTYYGPPHHPAHMGPPGGPTMATHHPHHPPTSMVCN